LSTSLFERIGNMGALVKFVQLAPNFPLLESIQAPQGERGAAVRGLCGMLNISHPTQIQRIRRNPDLRAALHHVIIDTQGGPQEVAMLESWAIAAWAAGLQTSRLSPASQEAARILKQHAYSAIAKAFSQPDVAESEPILAAPALELSSVQAAFDHIQHNLVGLQEGFEELKEHVVGIDQRLLIVEQDRLGSRVESGARLSAAQIGQLFMQLALLREQTGIPVEDAEKRLADQFGVAHIIDIDASKWPALHHAILALFHR
jgi:hypothetical protein